MKIFRPIDPIDTEPFEETPIESYPGYLGLFGDYQPTHLDENLIHLKNIHLREADHGYFEAWRGC